MPLSADGWFDDGFTVVIPRRVSTVGRTSFDANMWGAVQPETALSTGMAFESRSTRRHREIERRVQPVRALRDFPESEDVDKMMAWESRFISRVPHDQPTAFQPSHSDVAGIFPLPVWVQDPNTFAAPFIGPSRHRYFASGMASEVFEAMLLAEHIYIDGGQFSSPARHNPVAIQPQNSEVQNVHNYFPAFGLSESVRPMGHKDCAQKQFAADFAHSSLLDPAPFMTWEASSAIHGRTIPRVGRQETMEGGMVYGAWYQADVVVGQQLGWSSFSCHPTIHARPQPPIHTSEVLEQSPLPYPWTESTFTQPVRHDRQPGTVNSDPPWMACGVIIVSGPFTLSAGDIHYAGASAGDVTED